jgi:hypothetical protein
MSPKFFASITPNTAFVFSVTPLGSGVQVVNDTVMVDADGEATVIVAGVNRRFPFWDMPVVSQKTLYGSRRFWQREWHEQPLD